MKYKRVVIKLSGEALRGNANGILDTSSLLEISEILKSLQDLGTQIVIINGAGNICRGALFNSNSVDRVTADYMGMLGTVINSLSLRDTINSIGGRAVVLSAVKIPDFVETYSPELANSYLDKNTIVICGGGIGKPFFTTDTCATTRAIETKSEAILIAKNGVDGIYSDDPRTNKNAVKFDEISCSEIIAKNLKVMDLTAIEMLKEQDIDAVVFNMNDLNNFNRVINGETIGTTIKKG